MLGEDDHADWLGGFPAGLGVHSPVLQDSPLQRRERHQAEALPLRVWKEEISLRIQRLA